MITSPQMSLVKQSKGLDNDLGSDLLDKTGEPLTKKQKRKHTVLACESCHNNHLKCNGAEPCQQCIKRHTECRYSTPGKRGPKPGASSVLKSKLAQQEMSIQILTEELNRTKHEKEEWKQKYLSVVVTRQAELPLFQAVPTNTEEIPLTTLTKYLDSYKRYVHPLYPLPVAVDKPNSLQSLYSTDPQHALLSLQLSIVLAHGARMCQAHFDSNEFIKSAKEKARDFFDQSNYELAHTFLLISYFYLGNGDKNKASYFTALVYKSCLDLGCLESSPVGKKCLSLIATESEFLDSKDDLLSKFQDIQPDTSELVWLTFMQIYNGLHGGKMASMSLLRKLEEVESIMAKNTKMYSHFEYLNLQALVSGSRAGIFWNEKVRELGRESADKALEFFKDEEFHLCSPTVITSVAMVLQIYLAEKRLTHLQEGLMALDRLAELYPLSDLVRRRFGAFFESVEQILSKNNGAQPINNGSNNNALPSMGNPFMNNGMAGLNGNGFPNGNQNSNGTGDNGHETNNNNNNPTSSDPSSSSSSSSTTGTLFSSPEMTPRLKRILDSELELLFLFSEFQKTQKEIPWLVILNP